MKLIVEGVDIKPHHTISSFEKNGHRREYRESVVRSYGSIVNGDRELEFNKYFVTNHTMKKRQDFVTIGLPEAPELEETLSRINRALTLGKRVIRSSKVIMGAELSQEQREDESCSQYSPDMEFEAWPPLTLKDFSETPELAIGEDGSGLFWLRISNRYFDLAASNPAMMEEDDYAVFTGTESSRVTKPDLAHIKWDYADSLLTPSQDALPGVLGSIGLRAAIVQLRPGITGATEV